MTKRIATRLLAVLIAFGSTTWAEDGFVRDSSSECSVFRPNLKDGDQVSWKGRCMNGLADGEGVATWTGAGTENLTFEGTFVGGKMQGRGLMFSTSGDRYEGDYVGGKRHGQGTYFSATDGRYEGGYKDNRRHGFGLVTAANGLRTRSEWRAGVPVVGNVAETSSAVQPPAAPRPIARPPQATDEGRTIPDFVFVVGALFAAIFIYKWSRPNGSKAAVQSHQETASRDYVAPSERYDLDFKPQDRHVLTFDIDGGTISLGDREDAWLEFHKPLLFLRPKRSVRFGFFTHRPRSRVFVWRYDHPDQAFSIVFGISDEEADQFNRRVEADGVVIDVKDEIVDIVLHST